MSLNMSFFSHILFSNGLHIAEALSVRSVRPHSRAPLHGARQNLPTEFVEQLCMLFQSIIHLEFLHKSLDGGLWILAVSILLLVVTKVACFAFLYAFRVSSSRSSIFSTCGKHEMPQFVMLFLRYVLCGKNARLRMMPNRTRFINEV